MAADVRIDVLGLGCVAVDDLLYVDAYPPPDTKKQVRRRERQCGGLTATALVAAARLGARCAYAGVLGDDDFSHFVRQALSREGIDVAHCVHRAEARPIHSTIIVDETRHTRNVFFDLAGAAGADPEAPAAEVIRSARVLYLDHFGIEGMTRAARIARATGVATVADFERNEWPGFAGLLALVDHLIVSRDFAARLTGEGEPAAALSRLWDAGRQAVVVTCGAEGCWYRGAGSGEGPRHRRAYPVAAVDTTGCGDVFHGAYAAALARGLSLAERVRFASAAAALKALRPGGQDGIPTRATVDAFLAKPESAG
jgi:sugar/nucleoside kinase (ribokinase family)